MYRKKGKYNAPKSKRTSLAEKKEQEEKRIIKPFRDGRRCTTSEAGGSRCVYLAKRMGVVSTECTVAEAHT